MACKARNASQLLCFFSLTKHANIRFVLRIDKVKYNISTDLILSDKVSQNTFYLANFQNTIHFIRWDIFHK